MSYQQGRRSRVGWVALILATLALLGVICSVLRGEFSVGKPAPADPNQIVRCGQPPAGTDPNTLFLVTAETLYIRDQAGTRKEGAHLGPQIEKNEVVVWTGEQSRQYVKIICGPYQGWVDDHYLAPPQR
jgi:hypothetical protein